MRSSRSARASADLVGEAGVQDGELDAVRRADHLGGQRRPAHAAEHDVVDAGLARARRAVRRSRRPGGGSDCGRVTQDSRLAASSAASSPHSDGSFANSLLGEAVLDQPRDVRADRVGRGAGRDDLERLAHLALVQLVLDRGGELVPRLHELVDALVLEHLDDVVVVDADLGEVVHHLLGLGVLRGDLVALDLAVVGEGLHGLLRHGVDGVGDGEVGEVHRVAVVGVLDAGGGPQRALRVGAVGLERREALAGELLLVGLVGEPGVGDARQAHQVAGLRVTGGLEALVDLGVHAGDEERRHRVDGRRGRYRRPWPSRAPRGTRPSPRRSAAGRRSA